jgi:hypothetical protein
LKPIHPQPASPRAVECDLAAQAWLSVPLEAVADLRRRPGPGPGEAVPPTFLKHCDEQTVVGLAAVCRASHDHGLDPASFHDWGVLGGPCSFGRAAMSVTLQKFAEEGAWGVSPHLIPHRLLHAVSGAVSQALKIHGPNFGVGGGPDSPGEALLTAAALLARGVPGVWVVLTCHEPDLPPDRAGRLPPHTRLSALALALTVPRPERHGVRLRVRGDAGPASAGGLTLAQLKALLDRAGPSAALGHAFDGGSLEADWVGPPPAPCAVGAPLVVEVDR